MVTERPEGRCLSFWRCVHKQAPISAPQMGRCLDCGGCRLVVFRLPGLELVGSGRAGGQ